MTTSSFGFPEMLRNDTGGRVARAASWVRILSVLVTVVGFICIVRQLPVEQGVRLLSAWAERAGMWGPVIFGIAYVLAAILFVPGAALTLAAGAVYGLLKGTAIVSVASTTAAALAFLIARYAARSWVEGMARRNRRFAAIDQAIAAGGWKIIALLRLSPAVPFSAGNYLYGLTAIRFWPYVLTSWLAMLPGTFAYVYLGVVGRASLSAGMGTGGRSPLQWVLLVVGLLATGVVTAYVTRLARKALRTQTAIGSDVPQPRPTSNGWTTGTSVLLALAILILTLAVTVSAKQSVIKSLFGPPSVTLKEAYHNSAAGPRVDHSLFDELLHKHVAEGGWVDYAGLKTNSLKLDEYIASLARVPVDQLGRDEKLAMLINAYNAFTLRVILDHYPLASIKDIPGDQRWDAVRWRLGPYTLSLNQIEHEQIRPKFAEPRIHFALVCAAVGCPPLRGEAYLGDRVEQQLEDQARYVHTHERWFALDEGGSVVRLTSLYNWYGSDFEQVAGSVLAFAGRYSPPLKAALEAGKPPRIQWIDYDWKLNGRENQR